jgi:hypothetical protein
MALQLNQNTPLQINQLGPLTYAALYQINETIWFDKTRPPAIVPQDDDEIHTVTSSDRLDVLAYNKLGDARLGWVILLRNNLRLIPNGLLPGTQIYIPSRNSLQQKNIVQ